MLPLAPIPFVLVILGGPAESATTPADDPPPTPPALSEPPTIECRIVPEDEEGIITGLAFHPDGKTLAAANSHGMLKYFDVAASRQTRAFRAQERRWGGLRTLAYSPDGSTLFAGVYYQKGPTVLDAATGRERMKLEQPIADARLGIGALACSPNGKTLAAGFGSGEVVLWDAATGRLRALLPAYIIPAQTSPPFGHAVRARPAGVVDLAFSPDGSILASADTVAVRFWDVAPGKPKAGAPAVEGPSSLAFSPDGGTLAVADSTGNSGRTRFPIRLCDMATGRMRAEMTAPGEVSGVAFLPGGRTLVTLERRQIVRLWDAGSGRPLAALRLERRCQAHALAVSPDGKTIAAGGYRSAEIFGIIQLIEVDGTELRPWKPRP